MFCSDIGTKNRRLGSSLALVLLVFFAATACSEDDVVLGGTEADAVTGGDFDLNGQEIGRAHV